MSETRSKYGNKITELDGFTFRSKAEARRYQHLQTLEATGQIENLVLQPRYPLVVNGVKICTYVADFAYKEKGVHVYHTEDVKGARTLLYQLKAKLMLAVHGITVEEIAV